MNESWKFLREFFNSDKSIADVFNKALALKSNKYVRNTNVDVFLSDIRSLLPNGNQETTYTDFLKFVTPKDILGKIEDDEDLVITENRFLGINKDMEIGPYFALYALGINTKWFLYDKEYIEKWKDEKKLDGYMNEISDYLSKAEGVASFLYPFMILLIVLRREYNDAQKDIYTRKKREILDPFNNNPKTLLSILYGVYNQYIFADKNIITDIKKECKIQNIPLLTFHPLITANILSNRNSYDWIFTELNNVRFGLKELFDKEKENKILYKETEEENNEELNGKSRLVIHYLFPDTEIRDNDLFVIDNNPNDDFIRIVSLNNRIYLSIRKGEFCCITDGEYSNIPKKAFDYIQISEYQYSTSIDRNNRQWALLRNKLKPEGEFLLVRTAEEYKKEQILKEEFSNFRHDLQTVMNDYAIKNLKDELSLAVNSIHKLTQENSNTTIIEIQDRLIKCQEKIDKIAYSYHIVNSYILSAGCPSIRKGNKDKIYLKKFLEDFVKYESILDKRYILSLDNTILQGDEVIKYFKWTLIVILKTIIDNAVKHGFCNDYKCEEPEIRIIVEGTKVNYILRICNNGKPIDVTTEEYTTCGLFKGITGHTGLGGYQIYRYAQMHGGDVEVHSSKDWKTEIHLIIKK